MKDLLRLMIVASNKGGKLRIENKKWVISSSSRESRQPTVKTPRVSASLSAAAAPAEDTTPTPLPQPNVLFPTSSRSRHRRESVDSTDSSASCLLTNIDVVTESGAVDFMKISNLSSLELIFDLYRKGYGPTEIVAEMARLNVPPPVEFEVSSLETLPGRTISNYSLNIKKARALLEDSLEGYFVPGKKELLHEWSRSARMFSSGARMEGYNFEFNPNNGKQQLSLRASWLLRHIKFTHNLTLAKVLSLWPSFYALIMHRPMSNAYIISQTTLWNNIMRLNYIDNALATDDLRR